MEDSGIDSDSKSNGCIRQLNVRNGSFHRNESLIASEKILLEDVRDFNGYDKCDELTNRKDDDDISTSSSKLMTSLQLQKRLEKQIQQARKIRKQVRNEVGDHPKKSLIPRNRLTVPNKSQVPVVTKSDEHPLVTWESESEDEFDFHPMNKSAAREITQQLIKDGYNLDLTPDDEDLDLIPPKPIGHHCTCCSMNYFCSIQ